MVGAKRLLHNGWYAWGEHSKKHLPLSRYDEVYNGKKGPTYGSTYDREGNDMTLFRSTSKHSTCCCNLSPRRRGHCLVLFFFSKICSNFNLLKFCCRLFWLKIFSKLWNLFKQNIPHASSNSNFAVSSDLYGHIGLIMYNFILHCNIQL